MSDDNEKYIFYGGPEPHNIGDGCQSVGEFLLKQMTRHGDKVALIDGVTGDEVTFLQLKVRAIRLAKVLRAAGIGPNDVIGIVSENRIEFPVTLFATLLCGATAATINLTYSEGELDHAFNLSRPKIIFTTPLAAKNVVTIGEMNSSFVKKIVLFDTENPFKGRAVTFDTFMAGGTEANDFCCNAIDMVNHTALILCSSGTTGLPKGVQLTQWNLLVCAAHMLSGPLRDDIPYDELRMLAVLPWFHSFGCVTLFNMLSVGIQIVHIPKFEERLFLKSIETYRINCIYMVPPLMVFLSKSPLVDRYDLSSLRVLLSGAAPLSKTVEDTVRGKFPWLRGIRQGYGMSEMTLGVLWQTASEEIKPGSVGFLIRGMYVKVVDPVTGTVLGPHQPGELCFKGAHIMKGYIGNVSETKKIIDSEGFLHTGDVGYFDEGQQFFIVDRLKELIKYKGFQVPPAELEGILLKNQKIKDAAVIGLPDENAGELPLAYVVKQDGVVLDEKEVIDYVAIQVSPAKRLHGGVRFIAAIPKNPSGKILRRELRALNKPTLAKL